MDAFLLLIVNNAGSVWRIIKLESVDRTKQEEKNMFQLFSFGSNGFLCDHEILLCSTFDQRSASSSRLAFSFALALFLAVCGGLVQFNPTKRRRMMARRDNGMHVVHQQAKNNV